MVQAGGREVARALAAERPRLERARDPRARGGRRRRRDAPGAARPLRRLPLLVLPMSEPAARPADKVLAEVRALLREPPRRARALAAPPPLLLRLPDADPARARAARRAGAGPGLRRRPPAGGARAVARRGHRRLVARDPRGARSATAASGSSFLEGDAADPEVLARAGGPFDTILLVNVVTHVTRRAGDARGAPRREPLAHARADLQLQPAVAAAAAARRAPGHEVPPAARGVAAARGDQGDAGARGLRDRARRRAPGVPGRDPAPRRPREPLPRPAAARWTPSR